MRKQFLAWVMAMAGLMMATSPAQAESLSFNFSCISQGFENCQFVDYCINGAGFRTLYRFNNCSGCSFSFVTNLNTGSLTTLSAPPCSLSFKASGCLTSNAHILFTSAGKLGQTPCLPNCFTVCSSTSAGNSLCISCPSEADIGLNAFPAQSVLDLAVNADGLSNTGGFTFSANTVPEPSMYLMLGGGLGVLWLARTKKVRSADRRF